MDKILFIVPPNISYDDFINPPENVRKIKKKYSTFGSALTDMPLGVLSLSAYVKKNAKVETKLIDFNVVFNKLEKFEFKTFEDFFRNYFSSQDILRYKPSIIGITSLFITSYQNMLDIAKCCSEIFPEAILVTGGGVPTNMYKEIFNNYQYFNALCYGEGEKPLLGLIQAKDNKKYLEDCPSWITQKKADKGDSFKYDFIQDLDEIPLYDYSIINVEDYRLNSTISAYPCVDNKVQYINMMTSRGCPHRCCYCSAHTVHGRSMRYFSMQRIREDFTYVKEKYKVEKIIFQDDHFMANKLRVYEIITILKELNMTAVFPNSLALYTLDRKMLEALKSVGMTQLVMAIESGSERVLQKIMHKPLNLSIVKRVADDCRELQIFTDASIIIGFPGETKKDIDDARKFLKTINVNWFRIYTAIPLVGSELFDICVKNNYLKGSYLDGNFKKATIETENFTVEYIQETAYYLNLELNFVENSDYRLGNYKMALKGFENAIKAKNDHALAYYYASKCYEKLDDTKKSKEYLGIAKINAKTLFWRKYVDMFNITELL